MSKLSRKVVAVGLTLTTAVWLAGAVLPASAQTSADTINALMVQIQALQAQLQALQGSAGTQSSSYSFTRDLTLGSKGTDVTALQQFLVSGSYLHMPAGVAYGYFGNLTRVAVAAWQKAAGIYPTAGYFGPKSRAAVVFNSGAGSGTGYVPPPVTGAGVSVALSPLNPPTSNVPINSSATAFEVVPVLTVRFAAGASDVTVTNFNVLRSGLSSDQDLANIYLLDGAKIVTTNIGMNNGTVQFANAAGLFTVRAGTYKDISVAVSISSSASASGHTYTFSVPSAASVVAVGALPVSGNFPIVGNNMTAASVTNLGGLTVTNGSTSNNTSATALTVNAGQTNFSAGQFTLQANNQAVSVKSITLTNTASLSPTDLANIKLQQGATVLGTAAPSIGANNQVTFDLSANPLQLSAGQTMQLYVYADVVGGVNRYFQFSVQHNYDIVAQDLMFNIGFLPAMNTGNFPMNLAYVSVQQGTLTINRSTLSPVNYVLPGGTNQTVAKFDFTAGGEAVKITQLSSTITTSSAAAGTLTNVKVIDDQGTQIGTTQSTWLGTIAYTNLNYLIPAGTKRVISVIADVASTFTGTLSANVSSIAGQGYTSLATVPTTGTLSSTGNTLSATTNMLSSGLNSQMGNTNVVSGQNNARVGSFAFTAGSGSAVDVSNFTFSVNAGTSPSVAATFQNLRLMYGNTQIGNTQGVLTNGGSLTFSAATPIRIPAGGQIVLDVYADVKTNISATTTVGVVTVASNGVSATAVATAQSISTVTGTPTTGQTVAVVAAGALTYNAGTMPVGAQIGMGVTGVKLASYQVNGSTAESITITNVYLTATSSLTGLFTNFRLMNGSTQYGGTLSPNGTSSPYTLTWVGANIPVAQGGSLTLDVIADANTYSALSSVYTASANATTTVLVNQIDYQGSASSQTSSTLSTAYGNAFVVVRNTLAGATASGVSYTTTIGDGAVVGGFTFTAGNAANTTDPVYINTLVLNSVYSGATVSSTAFLQYKLLDAANGNQLVASATTTAGSGASVTLTLNQNGAATGGAAGGAGLTINKGSSRTLIVTADLVGTGATNVQFSRTNATVAISFQTKLTNFTWTDGTRAAGMISADTAYGYSNVPLVGSVNALSL